MPDVYQYEENSRRPSALIGLFLSCTILGVTYFYQAPWYFFAPTASCAAMLLWAVIANRVSGMQLTETKLMMHAGKWRQSVFVSEIAVVNIKEWMEGPPTITLSMKDGSDISIPDYCIGSSKNFTAALSKSNIPTQIT
jgi:hypothetical protein